eukprot:1702797-Prymnesium_polylepis.1
MCPSPSPIVPGAPTSRCADGATSLATATRAHRVIDDTLVGGHDLDATVLDKVHAVAQLVHSEDAITLQQHLRAARACAPVAMPCVRCGAPWRLLRRARWLAVVGAARLRLQLLAQRLDEALVTRLEHGHAPHEHL